MKIIRSTVAVALGLVVAGATTIGRAQKPSAFITENAAFAAAQTAPLVAEVDSILAATGRVPSPRSAHADGSVAYTTLGDWTPGFFPGNLWYLYELTGDTAWRAAARKYTELMEQNKYYRNNHDIGFIMNCSYGNGYRLTQDPAYPAILVTSAQTLCERFRPGAGVIQSWNATRKWACPVIIDNMMNLELLFEATRLSGDSTYWRVAVSHADRTMAEHYRPDLSCYHVVNYDPQTGEVLHRQTQQGLADSSAWARGQAWGLYGFVMCYRYTRDARYLDFAQRLARYWFTHPNMPKDLVPYWDFDDPQIPQTVRDASAAAIVASAMYELSTYVGRAQAKEYKQLADRTMRSLASPAYRAALGTNGHFILMHSTGNKPQGGEVDVPLIYADYYFLEGLKRKRDLEAGRPMVAGVETERMYWARTLYRIARPVLANLAAGTLRANMPVEQPGPEHPEYKWYGDRTKYAHLEALGRTVCGIAPWLELPADSLTPEGRMRAELLGLTIRGIQNAMDTASADYMPFDVGYQALVDAAHLAQGLLRAPNSIWGGLDAATKQRVIAQMKKTRAVRPNESNWLLFTAMIETFLRSVGEPFDGVRVDYPVRQTDAWYAGDGAYGDGPAFHWDYYNSYVIQPMLVDVVGVMADRFPGLQPRVMERSRRYAEVLERMISPEGTIPPVGRSLQYRTAALQTLSQMALLNNLPTDLEPGQARAALTAVIRRFMEQPGTFDAAGWLRIGFSGAQPAIGEAYTCTGSLYLCTTGFLALGLPASDPFWTAPPAPWTAKRAWAGQPFPQDHAIAQ